MAKTKRIGKYEIVEEIGSGGFAVVYKVRDPDLDQIMVLKVLRGAHAERPEVIQRFTGEARRAVRLRRRSIVRIYAVGQEEGVPYIAMEYLPGGTLADRLQGEPLPLGETIAILEQVSSALDYAHGRKLIHRDIKPANILFDEEGKAVLVDFGLVKSLAESGMTIKGTTLGTPHYMAPEQADAGADVDARVDVYALGVVAYEMLAGRVPFDADTPLAVLNAHAHDAPPDPCALNENLDEGIAAVLLKALEKNPEVRYESAGAFARALRQAQRAVDDAARTATTLEQLYGQLQESQEAKRWGEVVNLCTRIQTLDPDYRDVGTRLAEAATHLAEDDQRRQQEQQWGERYAGAVALLEEGTYAEAIEALEALAEQAPAYKDVADKLAQARAELKEARLYETAVSRLEEKRHDEACRDLLALLELDPAHADGHARLVEAAAGVLTQLKAVQAELKKATGQNNKLHTRVEELEAVLQGAQAQVSAYDDLLLAIVEGDQARAQELGQELAQPDRTGVDAYLSRPGGRTQELGHKSATPEGDLWMNPADGKEMVRISAGEFLYGEDKEKHTLPEYMIDKAPVTNAEYARFVAYTRHDPPKHWHGNTPPKEIADHPVVYVSWDDAVAYAEWAGGRLPSEEEWEKAARGTDGREYPWGNQEPTRELCNFNKNEEGTTPVGKYSPQGDSPYGCVDMAGNVWEWTASEHQEGGRVLRGGAFRSAQGFVRCAYRGRYSSLGHYHDVGFRLVMVSPSALDSDL